MEQRKNILLVVAAISLLGLTPLTWAAQTPPNWESCGGTFIKAESDEILDPTPSGPIDVTAYQAEAEKEGISTFIGDVKLRRRGQWLDADKAFYDKQNKTIRALGDAHYQDAMLDITSDSTKVNLDTDVGEAENARYFLRDYHARGKADGVKRQGSTKTELKEATFTTCNVGDNAWRLEAGKVDLNHETGVGFARNARLRLGNIPVLYLPFIRFPIDDRRKSGFLAPSGGRSTNSGASIGIPYYWNIAPNRDATITPRYFSERGFMLGGQFRYLNRSNQGQVRGTFLPMDEKAHKTRGAFSWQHTGSPWPRWFTNVDINQVSDNRYFEDFSNSLSMASTVALSSEADISYQGNGWNAIGRAQEFQSIDPTIPDAFLPYRRLPQFLVDGFFPDRFLGLDVRVHGEAVNFQKINAVGGTRVDLWPTVSLPLRTGGTYFTPSIGVRDTQYFLTNTSDAVTPTSTFLSRTLPIFNIDTGATFERQLSLGGGGFRQTLEPRAYYLYVPYQDQKNFPVFDTAPLDNYFASLFQPNSFTGADRMNDANQVTLALTSRLLESATGTERFRASVGAIDFFHKRRITLPDVLDDSVTGSVIVSEMAAQLTKEWSLLGEYRFNPSHDQTDLSSAGVRYRGENGALMNINYRYRRSVLQQIDVSGRYPIANHWNVVGRWYEDIRNHRLLEMLGGLEYDSCCWAIRVVGRSYITNIEGQRNTSILVQLELKGLGNIGQKVDTILRRSVPGYGPPVYQ
ncbi:organic solvent tolerance protein [Candidatus Nitrosoglobus terrae]|uniref:LPS-assembly protein LptD n=1 Tax=Candidatus Nitrosoglobus terrae TaxID=1630141 RepID=A0A1Q2SNR7_9GAMM|nr:organic solvent tolerance protein [Candidatus Nitrosoglobus terrae]